METALKKRKFSIKGITAKLMLLVAFIMLLNFFLVWLFGQLFFEDFYQKEKEKELLSSQKDAIEAYQAEDYSVLSRKLLNENIQITVIDAKTKILLFSSSIRFDLGIGSNHDNFLDTENPFSIYIETTQLDSMLGENSTIFLGKEIQFDFPIMRSTRKLETITSQITLLSKYKQDVYLILETPLQPIAEAAAISVKVTLLGGFIAFLIGGIVAWFISIFLTRPIREMNCIAQNIAKLDFSQHVTISSNDEVGLLGESINTMCLSLKQYTQALSGANKQLTLDIQERLRVEEAQKQLVSNISHELKTPLSLISGYAEGLKSGIAEQSDIRDEYCDVILDESQRMTKMIHQLLRLARLQSNTQIVTTQQIDIAEIANNMLDNFAISFSEKNIQVNKNFTSPIFVCSENDACEQTINNFLQNAIRHVTQDGQILITITQAETTLLEVFNTGSHIDNQDTELIWNSFYRGDKAHNREGGEVGLGLSIVKAHMQRHQTNYGVKNTETGVVFYAEFKNMPTTCGETDDK